MHMLLSFFMDLLEFRISRTPPESGSAPIGHVPGQSQQFEINYRGCMGMYCTR